MDEPDRNLDIENIAQIKGILSFHKPQTQIIAVVHNPLLIYALSKKKCVNFIELTPGYIDRVKKQINEIVYE
jgi:ABC-type cobalamin/Fe3+-siderophores transport system ATPase subunit